MKEKLFALTLILQFTVSALSQTPPPAAKPVATPPPVPTRPGQKQPDDFDVVRINTNLVQVDAVVTDRNGKIIDDLKPDEIEIYEDGRKQKITNFQYYLAESPAEARPEKTAREKKEDKNSPPLPPTRLKPEDIRRTIALVVDDISLSFESMYSVRQALKKFVDEQMQPGDLVAIIRTSGGMGALQQFTSDKRQLRAAIERVKFNGSARGGMSAFAPLGSLPELKNTIDGDPYAANETVDQLREDTFAVGTLGALSYVIRGLHELPGRKSILLVSDGFNVFNSDDFGRSDRVSQALLRLTDQANRASVVIYTMDARGLEPLGLTAADNTSGMSIQKVQQELSKRRAAFFESQNGTNYLAKETGGLAIRNTNDLSGGIRKVLQDQRGYYLIGYRPDESTFNPRTGRNKFHRLKLEVTRPGKFEVRMRNGFYGISDEEQKPARVTLAQQLTRALSSPFGATGVHLQLTSLFSNDAKVGSFMRSLLFIDAKDLTFTDEPDHKHKCVFDVLAMTFGDNGVAIDQVGKTFTISLSDKWYETVRRDGLVYNVTVPVKKPGAYQLRVSLRDSSSERIGSASQFVEVPDLKKNRLVLSGLSLLGATFSDESGQSSRSAADAGDGKRAVSQVSQSDDGAGQENAQASPAVRRFTSGMAVEYGFMVYNARLDKTTGKPQVTTQVRLFLGGKQIFSGHPNPINISNQTDLKRLFSGGRLVLGELRPGEYILQIVVTDALADEKHQMASQWMDFEIVK